MVVLDILNICPEFRSLQIWVNAESCVGARRCNTLSPVYALLHTWYGSESFGLTHHNYYCNRTKMTNILHGPFGAPQFWTISVFILGFLSDKAYESLEKVWPESYWKPESLMRKEQQRPRWWWELGLRPQICPNQDGISKKRFSLDCYWICCRNICLFPTRTMTFRCQTSGVSPTG